ncbi:MAG: MaoC family dehydratase [bacterium]
MSEVSVAELEQLVGKEVGVSEWVLVDQERINRFADCTEDHQFIHINEEAAKLTPFGGTIAHGFLSLSLLSKFAMEAGLVLQGVKMGVNYGFEKVRFLSPVKSGKNIRGRFVLASAEERSPGQWLLTYDVTVEIEDEDKPALLCQWLGLQFI